MSTIGIGITSYNDYYMTNCLLDSILFYTDRSKINRLIVIDDGSEPEHREMLKKVCDAHGVWLIENKENLGVAKSWNRLVNEMETDYIILLNNDVVVWKGWFESLKYALENNEDIGTISLPTLIINKCDMNKVIQNENNRSIEILKPWNKMVRSCTYNLPESREPVMVMNPIGCSFGFSRKMYNKILGFNEDYQAFYEEVDMGVSLLGLGHFSVILPCCHIYHCWGQTFTNNPHIDAQKIMNDSRQKFIQKYSCDQLELYKKFKEQGKFDNQLEFKYLNWKGEEKVCIIKEMYSPDAMIEW